MNAWSNWSLCSTTCGTGFQSRFRTCTKPLHGGKHCTGNDKEARNCTIQPCPGLCMINFLVYSFFFQLMGFIKNGANGQIVTLRVMVVLNTEIEFV